MVYSKCISWLDDTRIPFVNEGDKIKIDMTPGYIHTSGAMTGGIKRMSAGSPLGRFTPNLLCCDDVLNDGNITKTNTKGQIRSEKRNWVYTGENKNNKMSNITDKGSNSRYYNLDLWFNQLLNKLT